VQIVNVSTGGVLVETPSRLRPGTNVDLRIETGGRVAETRAEVSRCYVSRVLAHQVMFRAALAFEHEVSWLSTSAAPVGA
jgi:hypothetical protein